MAVANAGGHLQATSFTPPSALLLLSDGRFPSGGHAHSGGLEAVVAVHGVNDLSGLESFLRGRASTTGAVAAAFAAAVCDAVSHSSGTAGALLREFDGELEARIPSPALRRTSRKLGRQLLRAGRGVWPHPQLDELRVMMPGGPHHAVALGAVAAAAGLGPGEAALAAAYESVTSAATAGVRLLGLDPFAVHGVLARLTHELDAIAAAAVAYAGGPPEALPAWCAPLLDVLAEHHATWEVRLFAS